MKNNNELAFGLFGVMMFITIVLNMIVPFTVLGLTPVALLVWPFYVSVSSAVIFCIGEELLDEYLECTKRVEGKIND